MSEVAVLATGTELVRGELVNTNATWLAERLTELGLEVTRLETVGDERAHLREALERLGASNAALVCTGGLGPTTDDLTTSVVAQVLGVPLVRDARSLEAIQARFTRSGRTLSPSNAKQADFPEGARVLPNERGTAPGFAVRVGRAEAFFLPGVPSEMKAMFEASVAPALAALPREEAVQLRLRTLGLPESTVNDRLAGLEATHNVVLGYRASRGVIEVKLRARGAGASTRAEAAAEEAGRRLGEFVFATGTTGFPEAVLARLVANGATLALAESCTGGLIAELMTSVPGASRAFTGGVVAYANAAKSGLLGVAPLLLETHGAVSEAVARAMAEGARARFGATFALAVTGIAGPDGGSTDKPVGLVWFALAREGETQAVEQRFPGTREDVRHRAALFGLDLVRRALG